MEPSLVYMLKKYFFAIPLFIAYSATAQNIRLLESFDKILLSSKRYEVEGMMASFPLFQKLRVNDTWDLPEKKYIAIEYASTGGDEIILFFYEGTLYQKRLIFKYSLQDFNVAEEEFINLKKYIASKNVILRKTEDVISNDAYGGQVGKGITFYLTSSTKNYKRHSIDLSAALDFSYENQKTIAKIVGYELKYESVDLSKTSLDARTGFRTY